MYMPPQFLPASASRRTPAGGPALRPQPSPKHHHHLSTPPFPWAARCSQTIATGTTQAATPARFQTSLMTTCWQVGCTKAC